MIGSSNRNDVDRSARWPSWLLSLLTHAALLAFMIWIARDRSVRGAAAETTREVGIVLKSATPDGPMFEGEDDHDVDVIADDSAAQMQAAIDALPSEAETAADASALPQLPSIGPGDLATDSTGDASAMAQGAPPSRRGGGGGNEARVKVFGVEGVGTRFVYVFDRSISMKGVRLAAAKRELIASLEPLEPIHQFQIIFFNDQPKTFDLAGQNRLATGTDRDKALAKRFINGITAQLGTQREAALQKALSFQPDVVFLLTDADHPMNIRGTVELARRNGTAIQCIEYGEGPAGRRQNFLHLLATQTGGQYGYVDARQLGR